MAVLNRVLFSSAERVDLVDLLSIDSYSIGDFKYLIESLVGDNTPYILKGFDVINPGGAIGGQGISINVADSVVFYPGSAAGPFFFGLPTGNLLSQPLTPELRKNSTNFVYLTLSTLDTSADTRAFFDPDANGGTGAEFTQSINTAQVLQVTANVSVSAFPANTVPICKVVVGSTSIVSIQDCRDLLFRLGTGGLSPNPLNRYNFRALPNSSYERNEPPTTITSASQPNPFQGADKNILTLKEWMDVVMTKLAEIGGTAYWYQLANGGGGGGSAISLVSLFNDALATNVKSKGKWDHDNTTEGLLTWTEDILLQNLLSPQDIILRAGNATLANEQVLYLALVRGAAINNGSQPVTWINGSNIVNGATGAFVSLSKGDWISKIDDPETYLLRVEEFFASPNLGGGSTSSALAQSIQLSGNYQGTSGSALGTYNKGVYQASDAIVADRTDPGLVAAAGGMHWLALRSDTIENVGSAQTFSLTCSTVGGNGTTAELVSTAHGLVNGDRVTIANSAQGYNGTYQVDVEDANTFVIQTAATAAEASFTARYALITTAARFTQFGLQLESANHCFETNDTIDIAGTTNYNGTYAICVRSATTFTIPITNAALTESAGTATLIRMDVRSEGGISKLVRGEVIDIGSTQDTLNQWLGRNSEAETHPLYVVPGVHNEAFGTENYNSLPTDSAVTRMARLTMMMADKAQDKTIEILPENIDVLNTVTVGGNQRLSFTSLSGGTPTVYLNVPGTGVTTTVQFTGSFLALPVNSAAYVTINRNANQSIVGYASVTVAPLLNVPIDENVFVIAFRGSSTNLWLWNGTLVNQNLQYYDIGRVASHDEQSDRSGYLRSDDPVTWSGSALTFTSNIELKVLNTLSGNNATYTVNTGSSPINLTNGQMAWITIDRTLTTELCSLSFGTTLPPQTGLSGDASKDTIVLFQRIDVAGVGYLHIPLSKQVINPGQTVRLGASGAASGTGTGTGDDLDSLAYRASFRDLFDSIPSSTGTVNINAGFTDPTIYSITNEYFRMAYDASKTVTGTGTAMTLSGAPAFTVKVGDVLVVGGFARKITVVTSQTVYTIESAFPVDPTAAQATVSQAVYTVDLNNYAGNGIPVSTAFSDQVSSVLLDYNDSATINQIIPDLNVTPNVAYTASSDGTNYSSIAVRTNAVTDVDNATSLPTAGTDLFIRFFANKVSGSGAVNLLTYRAFFHKDTVLDSGGFALNQAYAMTDGTGSAVNCSLSVVSGKTRVSLAFPYTPGLSPGTPNGQLEVFINGQKVPRFLSGTTTPDAYYTESSANSVDLDSNYSGFNFSVEVIRPIAVIDTNNQNALRLNNLYDAIVGTTAQVASGAATHDTLTAAIAAVQTGGNILFLDNTITENVTVNKTVNIKGKGINSTLNGTLTLASGSSFSLIKWMQFTGNVTINLGVTGCFFTENWLGNTNTLTDNGSGNYKLYITE